MIISEDGRVTIKGSGIEVMADAVCILHGLYQTFSDKYCKEIANEKLVEIGRLAVMTDEELREALKKKIMDLAERYEL